MALTNLSESGFNVDFSTDRADAAGSRGSFMDRSKISGDQLDLGDQRGRLSLAPSLMVFHHGP